MTDKKYFKNKKIIMRTHNWYLQNWLLDVMNNKKDKIYSSFLPGNHNDKA